MKKAHVTIDANYAPYAELQGDMIVVIVDARASYQAGEIGDPTEVRVHGKADAFLHLTGIQARSLINSVYAALGHLEEDDA